MLYTTLWWYQGITGNSIIFKPGTQIHVCWCVNDLLLPKVLESPQLAAATWLQRVQHNALGQLPPPKLYPLNVPVFVPDRMKLLF